MSGQFVTGKVYNVKALHWGQPLNLKEATFVAEEETRGLIFFTKQNEPIYLGRTARIIEAEQVS